MTNIFSKKLLKESKYVPDIFWIVFTQSMPTLRNGDFLVNHFCMVWEGVLGYNL